MLELLADENIEGKLIRGLLRRKPELDLVRVQDVGLAGIEDPAILEWAAQEKCILLTHDKNTIPGFAYKRIEAGLLMSGVVVIDPSAPIGQVIEDILLMEECGFEGEWDNQVVYIP